MRRFQFMLFAVALCCLTPMSATAQTSTGSGWAFTCQDGKPPAANGSCRRGGKATNAAADRAAANRAAEEAARKAQMEEAERRLAARRKAHADSVRRAEEAAAEQRRVDAEKKAQFEREKQAGLAELRAVAQQESGLKDAVSAAPAARPGQRKAYNQALCVAGLLDKALRNLEGAADIADKNATFMVDQAAIIADGREGAVECRKAPASIAIPAHVDMNEVVAKQRQLIRHVQSMVSGTTQPAQPERELTPDEKRIQDIYRQQKANEQAEAARIAPVAEAQKKINVINAQGYQNDAAAIKRREEVRLELKKVVEVGKKLEEGKVEHYLVDLDKLLPKTPPAKNQ